jgi:hypothetical protein
MSANEGALLVLDCRRSIILATFDFDLLALRQLGDVGCSQQSELRAGARGPALARGCAALRIVAAV